MDQINLLENLEGYNSKSRPRTIEDKDIKNRLMKVHMLFIKVENYLSMLSKVEYFQ